MYIELHYSTLALIGIVMFFIGGIAGTALAGGSKSDEC